MVEFITPDLLYVLVFLIPGYLGFMTLLLLLQSMFPAFKYRPDTINHITAAIWAVFWSAAIYFSLLTTGRLEDVVTNMNASKFFGAIFIAFFVAEIIAGGIAVLIWSSMALTTLIRFMKKKPHNGQTRWSRAHLKRCWNHRQYQQAFAPDTLYLEIVMAARQRKRLTLHLEGGNAITGMPEEHVENGITEISLREKGKLTVVRLKDVRYVEVHT